MRSIPHLPAPANSVFRAATQLELQEQEGRGTEVSLPWVLESGGAIVARGGGYLTHCFAGQCGFTENFGEGGVTALWEDLGGKVVDACERGD
jgi:hypothetical protein